MNDQKVALLFLPMCDSKILLELLQTIFNKLPINADSINVRWSIQSFFGFINYHTENDMSHEIAMHDFLLINDQAINDIKKYINYTGDINKKMAHNLSFFIQLLRDEYPGIFYSILSSLQNLISKIGYDRLYKEIGSNFITFCIDPPIEFFQKLKEIDEEEISTFFQFHNNFIHTELTFSIQKKISNLFYYPSQIKGIDNSSHFTLTNSSLCKNFHFIDTIVTIANNSFINHRNTDLIQKAAEPILEILPYIIIANQSFIYSDYNQYSSLLSNKKLFNTDSIAFNLIERFQNDFRLLNFLSNQTGDEFCSGDLLINSFPFFLENVLENTDNILKLSNFKFFSISDKSAENDFNFVRSYGAFHLFLSLFQGQNQLPSNFQINNSVNQIFKFLCNISNAGIQSMVIVDLFSCIFIQDDKGQFLCHPFIAQQVIQILAKFDMTPYIAGANSLFEKKHASRADISITAWFNNDDISCIYNEINKKNWPMADKLTLYLPYYRKLYTQAMQADHYFTNENDEISSRIKMPIRLNVLLSKQTDMEKLREIQKKSSVFELARIIIDKRLSKPYDEVSHFFPIENKNIWQPAIEFSINFDQNIEYSLKNVKKYHDDHVIIGISKSLDDFLLYLYNYYRCAILIDSTTFDSIEDLFTFNFCKAIEGAIIQNKFEWASELMKYVKKDLFSFVFENISFFSINCCFVNNISLKFPIEATALSISNRIKSEIPQKYEKIVDYFNYLDQLKNNDEYQKNEVLINSLFNDKNIEIDDILFAIDHEELFHYMMNKFDNETIAISYYKIFNYISYVSKQEDELRIKQIEILNKIHQISAKMKPSEIVIDIKQMKNCDQYFDLLIDYLHFCTPKTEQTIPLCKLFSLSLSNDQQIDKILETFPDRFHVLLSHFFHVEGILSHLVKYSPSNKLQFLNSISMLPEKVFIDSNIFDADTIADSYIRYDSTILEMPKEVATLFKDEQLFTILKGTVNSIHSSQIFYHLFQFFENKNEFIDFWADAIENQLKLMKIDSDAKETETLNFFNSLKEPLKLIENKKFIQFKSLSKFVESRPFLIYRIHYSFEKLGHSEFLNEILLICNKIDNIEIMNEISKSFEINLDSFYLSIARIQLIFGDFNGSMQTIQKNNLKIDKYCNPRFYDSTFDFFIPISKFPIVDYEVIKKNSIENDGFNLIPLNVFQNISTIIEKNKKRNNISLSTASIELIKFLVLYHCDIPQSMSLFVSFSQFEEAFKILETINDKEEQIKMFIYYIYFPMIFSNAESRFTEFITNFDKNLEKTEFLWNALLEFFTKNDMKYGLMKVYQLENKLEDAAFIGFDILKDCNSFYLEVSLLGNIIFDLKSSINYRQSFIQIPETENMTKNLNESQENETIQINNKKKFLNQNAMIQKLHNLTILKQNKKENEKEIRESKSFSFVPVVINETKTFEEIQNCFTLAELQLKVCQFFIEQNETFSINYNITSSIENAELVSAQLILNHEFEIMKEIKEIKKLSLLNILFKVCDLLNQKSFDSVKKFMKSLSKNHAYSMLQAFSMSNDRQNILLLICDCFERCEQCFLFLEYNFIAESFALALEFKNIEIIPLIGHKAAILGDTDVVDQCNRILNIH